MGKLPTAEQLHEWFWYNAETGELVWKKCPQKTWQNTLKGCQT